MNELEKAIRKKIGNMDSQKARVWDKLQQKPHKNKMPYFVSAAFLVCMIIFTTMLLNRNSDESPPEQSTSLPTSIESPGTLQIIPIVSSKKLDGTSISYSEDYVINLYSLKETYEQMTQALSIEQEPIDFSKHDVLLIQFISDGCGLVVDQLTLNEQQLFVKLDLPEELRAKKEVICTSIAMQNTVLLVVPKLNITDGMFIDRTREIDPSFAIIEKTNATNTLVVEENAVEISFTNPKEKLYFSFNDPVKVKQITAILKQAIEQPGIANMVSPDWRITMENEAGETRHYLLWLDMHMMTATFMGHGNTHTIYSLEGDLTVQIADIMQNNAKDSVSNAHEIEPIIHQYIETIQSKKWDEHVGLFNYDSETKEHLLSFLKDSTKEANKEGIHTIQGIKLVSMELTSDLEFSSKGDYVYDVLLDMKVHKTSDFYMNGISRHVFVFNETNEGLIIETVYFKGLVEDIQ